MVSETADHMVIVHANGLHKGIDDRGADEIESAFFQILAHGVTDG